MHLDKASDERQADSEPPLRTRERLVDLSEEIENTREHLGRDADSRISDPDEDCVPLPLDENVDLAP